MTIARAPAADRLVPRRDASKHRCSDDSIVRTLTAHLLMDLLLVDDSDFFVSASGNDGATGKKASPVKTIGRGLELGAGIARRWTSTSLSIVFPPSAFPGRLGRLARGPLAYTIK